MKKRNKADRFLKNLLSVFMSVLILFGSLVFDSSLLGLKADAASGGFSKKSFSASETKRAELNFNRNWKFCLGDPIGSMAKAFDDSAWETVDLPHDFSISQEFTNSGTEVESGNLPTGTGWYRKMFTMPADYAEKEVFLNFGGVYNNAYVYVNGRLVAENHYGYNSFSVSIGNYITCNGSTWNLIAVKVESENASSRWYSGSGIYRDVTMTITNTLHVAHHGTYVTTPSVNGDSAAVNAAVTVDNDSGESRDVAVETTVYDPDGKSVASAQKNVTIAAKSNQNLSFDYAVASPKLWDTDSPYLYTLETKIVSAEAGTLDVYNTDFGIRTIEWNTDTGFYLNGKSVKLKGVCMHHDQGALGAVQEYDAIYRQLKILKDMGCNAIRTSHNSASRVLIELCNELGFLVMEEFFDDWDSPKNGNTNDFSKYFSVNMTAENKLVGASQSLTWAQFVVKETMMRDRNDPCVIIWDCANELYQASSKTNYKTIAAMMRETIRAYDTTRPITQGNDQSRLLDVDEYMDVIGANYHPEAWNSLKNNGTLTKPFVATESISAITSRGVYSYTGDRQGGKLGKRNYTLYSYDNSRVNWGSTAAYGWYYAAANDWFSGEFVWTGFDYIGEPTPWNNNGAGSSTVPNSSYFGIVDSAGFPKDQYYLYRSWWQNNDTTLHLLPGTWNKDNLYLNNGYAYVNVYSNADHIELLLNGTVIATAQSTDVVTANGYKYKTWTETVTDAENCNTNEIYSSTGHDLYAQFGVKYAEGTLSVKAYDASGNEIADTVGTKSVTSGKPAVKVVAKVWGEDDFVANGENFAYVEFEAVDEDGNFVNDYEGTLNVSVNNDGVIAGVDNGFQGTTEKFRQSSVIHSDTSASIEMFGGRALAIIRTTEVPNNVQVTASTSDGLTVDGTTFTSREQTVSEKAKYFENYILQSVIPYAPGIYDEYEMLKEEFESLQKPDGKMAIYDYYPVSYVSREFNLPSGDYIIYGVSDNPGAPAACGALTYTVCTGSAKGLSSTGVKGTPSATDPVWHFERIESGGYYIYYTDSSSVKHYINLGSSDGSLTVSETPYELTLSVSNGGLTIGNGTQYINYYGSTKPRNAVSTWSSGTELSLYTTDGTTVNFVNIEAASGSHVEIADGKYAIYCDGDGLKLVMTDSIQSDNKALSVPGTVKDDNRLYMEADHYFIIEKAGEQVGSRFYIKTAGGKYLNMGNSDGSLTLSDSPQALTFLPLGDGSVAIYNESSNQFLDLFKKEKMFSTWNGTVNEVLSHRKMVLYKKTTDDIVIDATYRLLYEAIENGLTYQPGSYDKNSFQELFNAIDDGIGIYKDGSATAEQRRAAVERIDAAIASLKEFIKKFPARLIKYGYNPSSANPYNGGSIEYNEQTYAAMRNAIKASDDLINQIKDVIDYDGTKGTVWTNGYADKALESAISKYAQIYSLSFRDYTVTGGSFADNLEMTAWNHWQKNNTQGASEKQDEGVSLQGIYSKYLGAAGVPVSHTAYTLDGGLTYLGGHAKTGLQSNVTLNVNTNASSKKAVELTALNNISVYVPDFFSANNVAGENNEYTKFYWNTDFPFLATTDSEGVNHYVYDSSDGDHMIRASYDDDTQTAVVDLENEYEWNVNRPYAGNGKGFFPFNYQKDEQDGKTEVKSYTGENGIYHFGMTFQLEFYIPKGGKYSKTSEDFIFSFMGDDDVLVYVDDTLVLDNGGLHGSRSCKINFTEASVSYQYAMNVADKKLVSEKENDVYYKYGETYDEISDVNKTAVEYLNKIKNDGQKHTFSFYYLERGSTESNCKITFNLQQISEHISLNDQTLVADFGLPIEYDATENNTITEAAVNNGAKINYIGVTNETDKAISFTKPEDLTLFDSRTSSMRWSGEYGNYLVTSGGHVTYEPTSTEFCASDSFYLCAEIIDDPTYSNGTVYYAYEKVTVVPATNIYYEEDFFEGYEGGISYTDGKTASNFDNSAAGYGSWITVTDGEKAGNQSADLVGDANANSYGYDPAYDRSTTFSNGTARKVTVSEKNNPNSKFSGGSGASWPKLRFSFTGTGFDLLSLTNNKTGIFTVEVFKGTDTSAKAVKRTLVDTYYGSSYVRLYADENGNPTGTVTETPLYWTKNNNCTFNPTYYGEDGVISSKTAYYDVSGNGYTFEPTYYDENKNLTKTKTDDPAYAFAYAYGWVSDKNSSTDSLYQIPVIGIEGLSYGEYTAVITAQFTTLYGHYNEDMLDNASVKSYDLYVDGIRIYDPAGVGNDIADKETFDAYKKDGEAYPNYIELRNMLIGADKFGESATEQGVIFIDGIPALDNDIEKYKIAGPNNELYLASGQAVAFEVWATAVPTDLQIFAKSAKGSPTLKLTYDGFDAEKTLSSATQMSYSFNSLLPVSHKLKWTQVTVDKKSYYTTGTLVIANSSAQDTILSLGKMKWTFDNHGAYGFFRIPTETTSEQVLLMSTKSTCDKAYSIVSALYTNTAINQSDIGVSENVISVGKSTVVTIKTSADVKTLLIKDENGNIVEPESIEKVIGELESDETTWNVTLSFGEKGTYVYTVTGVNEYGHEGKDGATFTVTVEKGEAAAEETEKEKSFFEKLRGFFKKLADFFKRLFGLIK